MINTHKQPFLMVILDKGAVWKDENTRIVHWAEMSVPEGRESIPLLVEQKAEDLRREYLAWVHELGEYSLHGRGVREHLRLSGEMSLWWLTLIAEKAPMKCPAIYEVFKLRALEQIYITSGCHGIILCSNNTLLNRVLRHWCRRMGHPYGRKRLSKARRKRGLRDYIRLLPYPVQAAATLSRRLWTRRRHLSGVKAVPEGGRQATVVTYFPNIDHTLSKKGIFRSRYWADLHDLLDEGKWLVNYIFLYTPSDECSFAEALSLRRLFQTNPENRARYYFLEEFIDLPVLLHTLLLYLRLLLKRFKLRSIREAFHFSGSHLNFWSLMANDWRNSLSGPVAMEGCLALMTFQSLVTRLPRQEWGLYLWENLQWERALSFAWGGSVHGKLIGYQHASLRFLDLRFYEDTRSYNLVNDPPPLPNVLAVNGAGAWKLLRQAGFPKERVTIVEAIRYMYLNRSSSGSLQVSDPSIGSSKRTLLVITSILGRETICQLKLLTQAAARGGLKDFERFLIKPHPDYPVEEIPQGMPQDLKVTIVHEPLSQLWPQASVVYAANDTTASLEAASLGLLVLVHVAEDGFNFSPMFGQVTGVTYVATVADLVQGVVSTNPIPVPGDFFCLEPGLPRWRTLLMS